MRRINSCLATDRITPNYVKVFFVWLLLFKTLVASSGEMEVPMEKAKKPKMDPKPEPPKITHKVFFDIEIEGGGSSGRVICALFGGIAPRTVENFVRLCACDAGVGKLSGKNLCYKGTIFHRISKYHCMYTDHIHFQIVLTNPPHMTPYTYTDES